MNNEIIKKISIEAELIAKRLSELKPGELVAYKDLDQIIGQSIQKNRHILYTAQRKVLRENNIVTVAITKQGIKRAKDSDYAEIVQQANNSIRKKAKRSLAKSLKMPEEEYNNLNPEMKLQLDLARTLCNVVAHCTSKKATNQLESAVKTSSHMLPVGRTLELFNK